MSARLEQLVTLHEDVLRLTDEIVLRLEKLDTLILHDIVEERDRVVRSRSSSVIAGMPCVAEVAWTGDDPVQTHDVAPPPDGFAARDEPPSKPV